MTTDRDLSGPRPESVLLALFLVVFVTLVVRTAWVSDDAYITFRVIDNFAGGHGLRWNVAERVQAYTHPLWMLLMTAAYLATRDVYYTSLVVSIALSTATVLLLALRLSTSRLHALLVVAVLCLAKTFLDYSTSGLENPLTHLLLAWFAWRYFRGTDDLRALRRLALIAGLAALNRLDSLALLGPPLLAAVWPHRWGPALRAVLPGFVPLGLWTAFSLFYYGFPLPNTVYAKLHTGIPALELAEQGLHYLFNSLSLDPLTMIVTLLGLALPALLRWPRAWPLAAGIVLHLAYVVRVGGDFMSGRFLAAPFLVALVLLARAPLALPWPQFAVALAGVAAVGLFAPYPPLTTTAAFYASRGERHGLLDARGITDERAIYYRGTGLLTASREEPMPGHYMARAGRKARAEGPTVVVRGAVGMFGFFAGPGVHIIDPNGLGDAFLARLPARPGWRIGHFDRGLPPGYEATVKKGSLRIEDPQLAEYYRKLRLVLEGDLTSPARLRAIWELNLGGAGRLLDDYYRIHSRRQHAGIDDLSVPLPEGTAWDAGTRRLSEHGIEIDLGGRRHHGGVEASLDGNDGYTLLCLREGYVVCEVSVPPRAAAAGGLSVRRVRVPPAVAEKGYDTIRLVPSSGDGQYALGHLRLLVADPGPDATGTEAPAAEEQEDPR